MKKAATAQQMTIKIVTIMIMAFFTPEMKARRKREIMFTNKVIPNHQHYLSS